MSHKKSLNELLKSLYRHVRRCINTLEQVDEYLDARLCRAPGFWTGPGREVYGVARRSRAMRFDSADHIFTFITYIIHIMRARHAVWMFRVALNRGAILGQARST